MIYNPDCWNMISSEINKAFCERLDSEQIPVLLNNDDIIHYKVGLNDYDIKISWELSHSTSSGLKLSVTIYTSYRGQYKYTHSCDLPIITVVAFWTDVVSKMRISKLEDERIHKLSQFV
jgi:hypothetical protein